MDLHESVLLLGLLGTMVYAASKSDVFGLSLRSRRASGAVGALLDRRFEVKATLGRGQAGRVFLAKDRKLGHDVVLKQPRAPWLLEDHGMERFLAEARVLLRVEHPNVVRLHDVRATRAPITLVMEYVEGGSLDQLLAIEGALPPAQAVTVAFDILNALDYIHSKGVVHRDLKPANILLDGTGRAKVTDFGIARMAPIDARATMDEAGTAGSPAYMSPEQARDEPVDARTDQYAAAAVLYEMLTGSHYLGHIGSGDYQVRRQVQERAPILPHPNVPPAIARVLGRALQKDPKRRFPDVASMRAVLDEATSEMPRLRRPPPAHERRSAFVERGLQRRLQPEVPGRPGGHEDGASRTVPGVRAAASAFLRRWAPLALVGGGALWAGIWLLELALPHHLQGHLYGYPAWLDPYGVGGVLVAWGLLASTTGRLGSEGWGRIVGACMAIGVTAGCLVAGNAGGEEGAWILASLLIGPFPVLLGFAFVMVAMARRHDPWVAGGFAVAALAMICRVALWAPSWFPDRLSDGVANVVAGAALAGLGLREYRSGAVRLRRPERVGSWSLFALPVVTPALDAAALPLAAWGGWNVWALAGASAGLALGGACLGGWLAGRAAERLRWTGTSTQLFYCLGCIALSFLVTLGLGLVLSSVNPSLHRYADDYGPVPLFLHLAGAPILAMTMFALMRAAGGAGPPTRLPALPAAVNRGTTASEAKDGVVLPSNGSARSSKLLTLTGIFLFLPALIAWAVWIYSFGHADTYQGRRDLAASLFPRWVMGGRLLTNALPLLGIVSLVASYFTTDRPGWPWRVLNAVSLVVACPLFLLILVQ